MKTNNFHNHQTSNDTRFTLSAIFEHYCNNSQFPYVLAVKGNQIEFAQSFHFPNQINNISSKLRPFRTVSINKRPTNLFTEAISKKERNENSKTRNQNMGAPENIIENLTSKQYSSKFSKSSRSNSKNGNINMSPLRFRTNSNYVNKERGDNFDRINEKDKKMQNGFDDYSSNENEMTFEQKEIVNKQHYPILPNNKLKEKGNTFKIINKTYKNEKPMCQESQQTNSVKNNSFELKQFDSFMEENKKINSHLINHVGIDLSFQNIEHFGENRSVEARIGKIVSPFQESIGIDFINKEKNMEQSEHEIKKESSRIHIEVSEDHSEEKEPKNTVYSNEKQFRNINLNNPESAKKNFKEDNDEIENIKNPYVKAYENEKSLAKQESKISKLTDEQVCQIISSRKKMIIDKKEGKEGSKMLTSDEKLILDMSDLDINALLKLDSIDYEENIRSVCSNVKVGNGHSFSKIRSKLMAVETQKSGTKTEIYEIQEEIIGNLASQESSRYLNASFVPHYLKDKTNTINLEIMKTENVFVPSNIYTTKPTQSQVFEVRRLSEQSDRSSFVFDLSENSNQ